MGSQSPAKALLTPGAPHVGQAHTKTTAAKTVSFGNLARDAQHDAIEEGLMSDTMTSEQAEEYVRQQDEQRENERLVAMLMNPESDILGLSREEFREILDNEVVI